MKPTIRRAAALALLLGASTLAAAGQTPRTPGAAERRAEGLRVFLDCQFYCDFDFMRTEIDWVDWVRSRQDAQVHILGTSQRTGAGGQRYTLDFIGLQEFAGSGDTLTYTSPPNAAQDETRRGLARIIKLGLVPFAAKTAVAERLQISVPAPAGGAPGARAGAPAAGQAQRDAWDYWVFRVGINGQLQGESSQSFRYLNGSLSANRTTDLWKLSISLNGNQNRSQFTLSTGTATSETHSYGLSTLLVRSVTPHWSVGGRANASSTTFLNQDLSLRLAPAVEYSFHPYSESTRRLFTLLYSVGPTYVDYDEVTLFDRTSQTLLSQSLTTGYEATQPWGSINVSLEAAHYLHDVRKYHAVLFGSTNLKLFKGFSFNIGGSVSRVRDQLHLARGELSDEEVLLRLRQLETSYRYFTFFGLSYSFGSIYNNIVNPRMGGGGGQVIFFN